MTGAIWLASYPKSGSTWLRILIGCLFSGGAAAIDINEIARHGAMAGARQPFDDLLLIDSGLLTHDEIDNLRPQLYEEPTWNTGDGLDLTPPPVRFMKAHDAYAHTPQGEPLLGGARAANGAIVIVRDPRDVAPSLANHNHSTIDAAIEFLCDANAMYCNEIDRQTRQLRQRLFGWSGHIASWLGQSDIPVHVLRYEELARDASSALRLAMDFAGFQVAAEDAERAAALAAFENLQAQERQSGFSEWRDRGGKGRLFFRRGETGAWRDELTPEQTGRIEKAHGAMMERLGYDLTASDGGRGR